MINVELYVLDQRLDLFDDEDIQLNLSIKNLQAIDKVLTDFTQGFTVPASPTNNAVFEHWYNKGVTTSFNPATKQSARIELNGLPYKRGVVSIDKAVLKNGSVDYYELTFFGGTTNIGALFGDDYINQLDLSAYDLAWSSYPTALTQRVLSDNVLIPLISNYRNWQYNTHTDSDSIKYQSSGSYGIEYDEVRPAISLTAIIDAIETKYGITINSDFFDTTEFGRLFMWANRTGGLLQDYAGDFVKFEGAVVTPAPGTFYSVANDWWTLTTSNTTPLQELTFQVTSGFSDANKPCEIIVVDANNGNEILYRRSYPNLFFQDTFTVIAPDTGGDAKNIFFAVRCGERDSGQFSFDVSVSGLNATYAGGVTDEFDVVDFKFTDEVGSADPITGETRIYKGNLPSQTVTEFMQGLIRTFNLVIEPISETEFNIEPLDDYYDDGVDISVGKYINLQEQSIRLSELFGEINFKYTETDSILAKNFKEKNDQGYGDLRQLVVDSNGDPISNQTFDVEAPFINLLWERLTDTTSSNDTITNILVAKNIDSSFEPLVEKPYIFYYTGQEGIGSNSIAYKNVRFDNASELIAYNLCYQFYGRASYTKSLNYGGEINPYSLEDATDSSPSLYNDYWSDYITDLYDISQRRYTFKGVLPISVILDLRLNATLIIGLNQYRINAMKVNLTTGESTLDLINIIA